jgi:hypothetical protein
MVKVLDGLLEANGDEQAEDDGGDVDEEVSPGAGGVMGGVDVEHGATPVRVLRQSSHISVLSAGSGRDVGHRHLAI